MREPPWHRVLQWLTMAALVGCSESEVTEPASLAITIDQTGITVLQGQSSQVVATATLTGVTGTVEFLVSGLPSGATAGIANVRTTGSSTSATTTIDVSPSAQPGNYQLHVRGRGPGVESVAGVVLTVTWAPLRCMAPSVPCEQWATNATASSEWDPFEWSAHMATGPADVLACTDAPAAWASAAPDRVEWLELTFPDSVRPTEIQIHENYGVSSIVKVEVKDAAGTYRAVYTATPGKQTCPRLLTVPVTGIDAAVRVVRVTVDQSVLQEWNEIDAVKLIGIH